MMNQRSVEEFKLKVNEASPDQKEKVVRTLQKNGEVVGLWGMKSMTLHL